MEIQQTYTLYNTGKRVGKNKTNAHLKAMKILAMKTVMNIESTSLAYTATSIQKWESDSGMIEIENRWLACMSHNSTGYVRGLNEYKRVIEGTDG